MKRLFTKTNGGLLLLVCIWGISWPIYKLSVPYSPPLIFAGLRALFGGLLLAITLYKIRNKINWRTNWPKYCISALFNTVLFFGFHTVGLMYLPGGLFSVLVYFQPVLLGLFAWLWLGENMTVLKLIGLLIGFIGIIIVSIDGLIVHISVIGVVLGLVTAFVWALGVVYIKKVGDDVDAYWMVALQFIIGGFVLLISGTVFESWTAIHWNGIFLFGLGFGVTMGIPVAYVIYYTLVRAGEASKVGSFTFLVPIISVFVGVLFLDEPATFTLIVGLLLVVLSIYMVNSSGYKWLHNYKKYLSKFRS